MAHANELRTWGCRGLLRAALAAALLVAPTASVAGSPFTTAACLAQKRAAWGALRQCQAKEAAKALKAGPADPAKCQTRFAARLAKSDARAARAVVPCRYGDNGDGTVTDYDSGLQWEQKTGVFPPPGTLGICTLGEVHCVLDLYDWRAAQVFVSRLNGTTGVPVAPIEDQFAGFSDWRLPILDELQTIVVAAPVTPRIDPIFGSTAPGNYWSDTRYTDDPDYAYSVGFEYGGLTGNVEIEQYYVRGVRSAF